ARALASGIEPSRASTSSTTAPASSATCRQVKRDSLMSRSRGVLRTGRDQPSSSTKSRVKSNWLRQPRVCSKLMALLATGPEAGPRWPAQRTPDRRLLLRGLRGTAADGGVMAFHPRQGRRLGSALGGPQEGRL